MTEKIKEKVLEFADIAKVCPERLQEKCFEVLLTHYLNQIGAKTKSEPEEKLKEKEEYKGKESKEKDIIENDLHVKVRQLLKKYGLAVDHINQIFYKEENEIKPLYDDLKSTESSESQIRIALLQALKNAIQTGDFQFNGEEVRAETQTRKCYDAANFAAIFRRNRQLFDAFEAYDKATPSISLGPEGKAKLVEVIKELQ